MGKIKGARAPSSSFLFPPSLSLSHPFFSLRFQPSFSTHKNTQTGKKLYWNEYGVGGGTTQDGKNKAITAQQAAATPFFGVSGRYNRSRDPWTLFDPATPNPVRDYLRYFYGQTLNYASSRVSWSWRESFFFVGSFFERKKEEMKKNAHVFSSFRLSLFSSSPSPLEPPPPKKNLFSNARAAARGASTASTASSSGTTPRGTSRGSTRRAPSRASVS